MRILVAYLSRTGNTAMLAETIFTACPPEKGMRALGELPGLEGHDLIFFGSPIESMGLPPEAEGFLRRHGAGKRIALFLTHGAPDNSERVGIWLAEIKGLLAEAGVELAGLFHCQGEVSDEVREHLLNNPDPVLRGYGRETETGVGQPDDIAHERAKLFTMQMTAGVDEGELAEPGVPEILPEPPQGDS